MRVTRRTRAASLLVAAALAAMTGCSTKAPSTSASSGGGSGSSGGSVQTGRGISNNTIHLGVLTDLSGVFAALGKDVTNANKLYWDQVNSKGGVCGKYKVDLNVKDHGYNVQQAVQLYSAIHNDVLAMQHTIGSPINTALADQMVQDNMVNIPEAWARNLTIPPPYAVVGATYDIEMINVLDYLLKQGKIKPGDKIGHIYFEGEYGENGLAGAKYFASKHNMTVIPAQIKSTDKDMSSIVTGFKSQGVNAIALTVAPEQTASAASVAQSSGLDVPIAGNNPVFAPGLLDGAAGQALKDHLYIASPVTTFDNATDLLNAFTKTYPGGTPSLGVIHGYADSMVMDQILETACKNGNLTPEGVLKAKKSLTNVDTAGLVVPLDFTVPPGDSPSKESYILVPQNGPGGAKALTAKPIKGEDVDGYTPAK